MKPEKAYIIRIGDPLSREYAAHVARSCDEVGLPYEYIEGVEGKTAYDVWSQFHLPVKTLGVYKTGKIDKAACATASHILAWERIMLNKEAAVILEHDALMLHPIDIDIPDFQINVLGYKMKTPSSYDHISAGPPTNTVLIDGHEGAHAYAITWKTAAMLIEELATIGVGKPVDNTFFLKMRSSKIPLHIVNPTPAVGWIRESTIWQESSDANYEFIPSFAAHLKP